MFSSSIAVEIIKVLSHTRRVQLFIAHQTKSNLTSGWKGWHFSIIIPEPSTQVESYLQARQPNLELFFASPFLYVISISKLLK